MYDKKKSDCTIFLIDKIDKFVRNERHRLTF